MDSLDKLVSLENEASDFGFLWETPAQIMEQIQSECAEINEHLEQGLAAADKIALQEEIGDLLHAAFSLCVFCNFNPEETLDRTLTKFEKRLKAVKSIAQEQGLSELKGYPFAELMNIWRQAKGRVG